MTQFCIVVADDTRARLFTIEQPNIDGSLSGPRLAERIDMANPEGRVSGFGSFTSSDGRARGGVTSSAHGFADHRPGHSEEIRTRFAQRIATVTNEFIQQHALGKIVWLVAPQMLGALREQAEEILPRNVERVEFAEELSWHSVPSIERALLRHGLLPERVPTGSYRPHGQEP